MRRWVSNLIWKHRLARLDAIRLMAKYGTTAYRVADDRASGRTDAKYLSVRHWRRVADAVAALESKQATEVGTKTL